MKYPKTDINTIGIAIKYHGTSIVSPNQFTAQDESDNAIVNIRKNKNIFFTFYHLSMIKVS